MKASAWNILGVVVVGLVAVALLIASPALVRSSRDADGVVTWGVAIVGPPVLVALGWRDERDAEPRSAFAATVFIMLPVLLPLLFAAIGTIADDPKLGMLSLVACPAGILGTMFGSLIRTHHLPSGGRMVMIALACVLSLFGGTMTFATLGAGC